VNLGIAGRVAVVTGASRGIGRAVATALASEGVSLVLSARGSNDLEHAADELRDNGATVIAVTGDVCDPATTTAILAAASDSFGGVDILVNNAGGESGHMAIDRLEDSDWEYAYRLNVVSAVRLTVGSLPKMTSQRWGRVVNISSYTARVPEPFCGPYAAAKAALVNVTRNLSRAYASVGICANCVLPGLTDTEGTRTGFEDAVTATGRPQEELVSRMLERAPIDAGRLGTSEEVAAAVAFLCSEQASWITGASLSVDGGTVRTAP
jgi:NAD(P)-dependent dehydrogenase (short-subunit alcohol dehydrogenase family)